MSGTNPAGSSLAERLRYLLDTVLDETGQKFSYETVAEAVAQHSGEPCSRQYIGYLLKGQRDNPTMRVLEALADFFGVPASYFFDDEKSAAVREQLELLALFREHGIQYVELRALAGLTPEQLAAVITEVVRQRPSASQAG